MESTLALICWYALMSGMIVGACFSGRSALFTLSVVLVVAVNVPLAKQFSLAGFVVPLGVVPFAFLYIVNDLAVESGDRRGAYRMAIAATLGQAAFAIFVALVIATPGSPSDSAQVALERIFSLTPRITLAGLVATLGSFANVWIYSHLKEWWDTHIEGKSLLGARSALVALINGNISAAIAELINTTLFMTIAFAGVLPDLADAIVGAWLIKVLIGFFGMPLLVVGNRILSLSDRVRGARAQQS